MIKTNRRIEAKTPQRVDQEMTGNMSNIPRPQIQDSASIKFFCEYCGSIGPVECDCLSALLPPWKLSCNAAKMLRDDFGFHVPISVGDDAWDDRLFFKRLDGNPNLKFLGLEQFPEEIMLVRKILIDRFNEPATELNTQRDVAITDGGNKYEDEVPKGKFKGSVCLILRKNDILSHLNDLPDTKRRIAEIVRQNELTPPRVVTESCPMVVESKPSERSNQSLLNCQTPAIGTPTHEDREFNVGDIVFHSTFTTGTVTKVETRNYQDRADAMIFVEFTDGNIRRWLLSTAGNYLSH